MKRLGLRAPGVELPRPVALEVNRVGQHQSRQRSQKPRLDQLGDLPLGLARNPAVDGLTRGLGRMPAVVVKETNAGNNAGFGLNPWPGD